MNRPLLIAGPCAAESREQVLTTAASLAAAGVQVFRAGVWKPRTQPGAFEGVGEQAFAWLAEVKTQTGMQVITEVATPDHLRMVFRYHLDGFWLGARTTTNPFLVQQIADALKDELAQLAADGSLPTADDSRSAANGSHQAVQTPPSLLVLVKNPVSPDLRLWKGAFERLQHAGAVRLLAVHRGFQTGQPSPYRNAPVWSVPFALKVEMPHVPLILDPSHMAGRADLVPELANSGMTLGYDGLMVEVHCRPAEAQSDRAQQLSPTEFVRLIDGLARRTEDADAGLMGLRSQLDEIDDTLFSLLLNRMHVSRQIGAFKREHHMPVLQEKRYAELLEKRLAWAQKNDLDTDVVRRIMDAIHEESCRWQL